MRTEAQRTADRQHSERMRQHWESGRMAKRDNRVHGVYCEDMVEYRDYLRKVLAILGPQEAKREVERLRREG